MGVFDKLKKITANVKKDSNSNVRYIEVDGIRYAVGIGYIIELTKQYNERYKVDASIDEVLQGCFGNAKVTDEAIKKIVFAIAVSINYYNKANGRQQVDENYVINLIDDRGFGYVGKVVLAISSTITAMMVAGADDKGKEQDGEQKKS